MENAHIMVFYGKHLRILQVSSVLLAVLCAGIASATSWPDEALAWLSFPLIVGYAIGEEVLWLRLEKFARGVKAYGWDAIAKFQNGNEHAATFGHPLG